ILYVALALAVAVLGPATESHLLAQGPKNVPPVQQKEAAGKKIDDRQRIVGTWRFVKWQANGVDIASPAFRLTFTGSECVLSLVEEFVPYAPAAEYLPFTFRYVLVWPGEIECPPVPGGVKGDIGI